MAPSQLRPVPVTTLSNIHGIGTSRVNKNGHSQSSPMSMPGSDIVEQFRVNRDRPDMSDVGIENEEENEVTRRRTSYTKEQKLRAIRYATTTWRTQKDGSSQLISKHAAAKELGITTAMLRQWMKASSEIESSADGTRKNRIGNTPRREPRRENRSVEKAPLISTEINANEQLDVVKAAIKASEWSENSLVVAAEARQSGFIAIRILSDAFLAKCGFQSMETLSMAAENAAWQNQGAELRMSSKAQCVFRNLDRLNLEAEITQAELRFFMSLSVVTNPDNMLICNYQNEATYSLTVGLMAYQLQRLFRASPDPAGEKVMRKIFQWICGKPIKSAINDRDNRLITKEGIQGPESSVWERVTSWPTEFDRLADGNFG